MQLIYVIGSKGLINEEGFQKALYAIDIGQNDLSDAFGANLPYDQVIQRIPSVISQIKTAIKASLSYISNLLMVHNLKFATICIRNFMLEA